MEASNLSSDEASAEDNWIFTIKAEPEICDEIRDVLSLPTGGILKTENEGDDDITYLGSLSAACAALSNYINAQAERRVLGVRCDGFHKPNDYTPTAIQKTIEEHIGGWCGWVVIRKPNEQELVGHIKT